MTFPKHGDHLHGEYRWCANCHAPVYAKPGPLDHLFAWGGKKCPACKTIWPEHEVQWMRGFLASADAQEQVRQLIGPAELTALLARYGIEEVRE